MNYKFPLNIPPDMEKKMKTLTFYRPNAIQNIMSEFDNCLGTLDSLLQPAAKIFNHTPVVDVWETNDTYVLEMELPGYDEKNIEVHADEYNLTIASKMKTENEQQSDETGLNYLIRERRLSSFSRSFKLPQNADTKAVSAVFKNGVLSLEIKKRTESQKRAILINAA